MKFISKHKSPNYNYRKRNTSIKYIVLHYTAMRTDREALIHLCSRDSKVSSHFFISKLGHIFNLVDLKFRAWHAGKSYCKGERDINSNSIGIEISNSGHHINFEKYTIKQIIALTKLLLFLKEKFAIHNNNILGHSDIAPYRKIDPGEKFPWLRLNEKKITVFPNKMKDRLSKQIDKHLSEQTIKSKKNRTLYMLKKIGYDTSLAKKDIKYFKLLMKVYQMRYNKLFVTGKLDLKTYEIIKSHYNQMLTI